MSLLLLFAGAQPPYHQTLLRTAKRMLEQDEPMIAVVVAHAACEIFTEQVLALAFKARGVALLEDWATDTLQSNNLANERTRKLYTTRPTTPFKISRSGMPSKMVSFRYRGRHGLLHPARAAPARRGH